MTTWRTRSETIIVIVSTELSWYKINITHSNANNNNCDSLTLMASPFGEFYTEYFNEDDGSVLPTLNIKLNFNLRGALQTNTWKNRSIIKFFLPEKYKAL